MTSEDFFFIFTRMYSACESLGTFVYMYLYPYIRTHPYTHLFSVVFFLSLSLLLYFLFMITNRFSLNYAKVTVVYVGAILVLIAISRIWI